jgi:hypothetical protein
VSTHVSVWVGGEEERAMNVHEEYVCARGLGDRSEPVYTATPTHTHTNEHKHVGIRTQTDTYVRMI